jgi:hypothetical protein
MSVPNKKSESPEAPITLATLPPPDTERWVARRKAQVVAAVQSGLITVDEAQARYRLSLEEFASWQRGLYRHGIRGLQITHFQLCKLAERRKGSRDGAKQAWRRRHA